jgi:hypothetical protein
MRLKFLRQAIVIVAAGTIGFLSAPAAVFAQERDCAVPGHFYAFEPLVPKTAKALTGGHPTVIAALGGASTVGLAAGKSELAWPARLATTLEARFPSAHPKVINLGVGRQTAKRAAERLDREVLIPKPILVIWETGTMEAVRGTNVEDFRNTLQSGINTVRGAGVEVMLMNMQFSRDTDTIIEFGPYLTAMSEIADANDVPLFRRHGIMRYWAETGSLDLRTTEPEKRRQVAAKLYDCIGRAMADFVTRGIPPVKPAHSPESNR